MDVSKNTGTPKWMVYFMETLLKWDDLGVPLVLETPISTVVSWHLKNICPKSNWIISLLGSR